MKNNERKKVLIISQHYWPETFRVTDIAEGLVENGYDVEVLSGIPNYPAGKFFPGYGLFKQRRQIHNGVKIRRVPELPRGNNSNFRIFLNFISFPFFTLFYLPMYALKKYDRIIVYQLSPVFMALPGIMLSKLKGVPLYIYVCDFWPHSLFSILNFKSKILRSLVTKVSYWHYRKADGVIGVFKGIETRLIEEVGISENKAIYIAQAPEKIYEKSIADEHLNKRFKGKFNIVFAGNINPAQSFETVLAAAKKVIDKGHKNIRFIIIGEGMSKKWLENEVEKLNLSNFFVFEGFKPVEDIPKYQTIADALIVALSKSPLFEYGIPAKVQSYMASGKPLIAAMDGEGKRLINKYSKCGVCVDSGDSDGLANGIMSMLRMSSAELNKMGQNGQKYYLKHFERNYNLNRLIEFVFNDTKMPDLEYSNTLKEKQ